MDVSSEPEHGTRHPVAAEGAAGSGALPGQEARTRRRQRRGPIFGRVHATATPAVFALQMAGSR